MTIYEDIVDTYISFIQFSSRKSLSLNSIDLFNDTLHILHQTVYITHNVLLHLDCLITLPHRKYPSLQHPASISPPLSIHHYNTLHPLIPYYTHLIIQSIIHLCVHTAIHPSMCPHSHPSIHTPIHTIRHPSIHPYLPRYITIRIKLIIVLCLFKMCRLLKSERVSLKYLLYVIFTSITYNCCFCWHLKLMESCGHLFNSSASMMQYSVLFD